MKKSLILLSILCLNLWSTVVFANGKSSYWEETTETVATGINDRTDETWEFYATTPDPTPEELYACTTSSKFGKKASYYYALFKEAYVTKETVIPGDPTQRIIIRKPDIYNAVRNIEKYLSRSLKKNEAQPAKIEDRFCHILKISLAAIDSDTDSFEKALNENRKNPQDLLNLFDKVLLKNIY